MEIMAESRNYVIMHEYENVYLKLKSTSKTVFIGDFYGEPESAVISQDEKYCAAAGSGIIIYYLREPFLEYNYQKSNQWKEWGREPGEDIVYINNVL